jgi:hypothetical protein
VFHALQEVESHVYTDYSQMQQDVTAALHGAAAGTTTNPMLWSSSLQVAMEGHQITTYAMVATGDAPVASMRVAALISCLLIFSLPCCF